ncbi:MAG: carboxynorspermidine decarboxylase [Bacteroidaceae bacterium]|nr:carboxynorspermidine decarboxylase [Bacteroidaceae bacterium]
MTDTQHHIEDTFEGLASPAYVMEQERFEQNLQTIHRIEQEAGVEFALSFKAFALWKTFGLMKPYVSHISAASPDEARLGYEEFGTRCYTYSPAFEAHSFAGVLDWSSHVTFNSLAQYKRFYPQARSRGNVSVGLRINLGYSEIETLLYNPCAPGSRFGVAADALPRQLPEGIEGFLCHNHCESDSYALERSLEVLERDFGAWLPQLRWLNLGGGHLVTRRDYDIPHLVRTLRAFRERHPHLHIILEPGSAFAWQTGTLVATVCDIVVHAGIQTAVLNVSFTAHMPDCLEMPYHPTVRHAVTLPDLTDAEAAGSPLIYRLGGNSCLSGDWMGYWQFEQPLQVGQRMVFEDMIHYTTVKTTTFNGIRHPSLYLRQRDGALKLLRQFGYEDYRDRMD